MSNGADDFTYSPASSSSSSHSSPMVDSPCTALANRFQRKAAEDLKLKLSTEIELEQERERLSKAEDALARSRRENEQLRREVQGLRQELVKESEDGNTMELKSKIARLERQLQQAQESREFGRSCADCGADRDTLEEQVENLKKILESKNTVVASLKQQTSALQFSLNATTDRNSSLEEALKSCKQEVAELKGIIEEQRENRLQVSADMSFDNNAAECAGDILWADMKDSNFKLEEEVKTLTENLKSEKDRAAKQLKDYGDEMAHEYQKKIEDCQKWMASEQEKKDQQIGVLLSEQDQLKDKNVKLMQELQEVLAKAEKEALDNKATKMLQKKYEEEVKTLAESLKSEKETSAKLCKDFEEQMSKLQGEVKTGKENLKLQEEKYIKLLKDFGEEMAQDYQKKIEDCQKWAESEDKKKDQQIEALVSEQGQLKDANYKLKQQLQEVLAKAEEATLGYKAAKMHHEEEVKVLVESLKSEKDMAAKQLKDFGDEMAKEYQKKIADCQKWMESEQETKDQQIGALLSEQGKLKHENEKLKQQLQEVLAKAEEATLGYKAAKMHHEEEVKVLVENLKSEKDMAAKQLKDFGDEMAKEYQKKIADCQKWMESEQETKDQQIGALLSEQGKLKHENEKLKQQLQEVLAKAEEETINKAANVLQKKYEEEIKALADSLRSEKETSAKLCKDLEEQVNRLEGEVKTGKEDLKSQKEKYINRFKEFGDDMGAKYQKKIEDCQKWMKAEQEKKDQRIKGLVSEQGQLRGEIEKLKQQLQDALDKAEKEAEATKILQKKYDKSKELLQGKFNLPNASVLQKSNKSAENPPNMILEPEKQKQQDTEFTFKPPSHTPGRSKPGRTQSELPMSKRPPAGSGPLFTIDDEPGETFSSSFLSDLKLGRGFPSCDGRLSELARRNTLYPAHLQSSYPAETQFFSSASFAEMDLQKGNISDVHVLTERTSQLAVNSPAANTRSRASLIHREQPQVTSTPSVAKAVEVPTRKRRSTTLAVDNSSVLSNIKRSKRDQSVVVGGTSYSRPGPPTPAMKGKRAASNRSVAEEGALDADNSHDRTPLLDTTNSSLGSARSFKSRIIETPQSLKEVLTGAFGRNKRKKYDVKL